MKACKRIEIIIEDNLVRRVIKLINEIGAPGYTVIGDASGSGDRGIRRGDELAGDSRNCVILIACDDPQQVDAITEGVRPLLSRFGGLCLVQDAEWVRHG